MNIANDRVPQVRSMLERGVDPNAFSAQGLPAPMHAVTENAWNAYDLLVSHPRTDIHQENAGGESLLMYLSLAGETARAADLIRRGAQVNRLGWTPLMYAASTGRLETVQLLLEHQAIVNSPGPNGETALMMAAYGGNAAVVRRLLEAGADATVQDLSGKDAADWARLKNHSGLAGQLDDLVGRVLARRAQQRASGSAEDPGIVQALEAAPEAPAEEADKPAGKAGGGRYFDLERFDSQEPAQP